MLKIKLIKSIITQPSVQKKTVKAMGFTKLNQVRSFPDNDCVRGMIDKIKHLVEVENE